MIISVSHLTKEYQSFKKEPGFLGAIRSVFARKYDTIKAVDDISFEITDGELVGFIGPNGAGKTTTLKCLSGLLYPTDGKISVLDHEPFKRKTQFLKQISLIMGQKNQLWWDLPPMETFLLNKEIYEVPDTQFRKVIGELSNLLDVKGLLSVQVKKLSLGERMKCELISALLHSPKVLFLDEPTIGLDVVMQKNLREFIREYNSRYNATIILTSHYMTDVEELCKRVIIINHGKILYDGQLTELVKKFAPNKIVKVVLSKQIDQNKLKSFKEIKSFIFPELTFAVSQAHLSGFIGNVLKSFPIEDLTVEDPAIEDVIRDVFAAQKV